MGTMLRSFIVASLFVGTIIPQAWSYEVREVSNPGTLEGTVSLRGDIPPPQAFNLITFPDPEYCGRISNGKGWRLLPDFVVDSNDKLQGAIVTIEGVQGGKPFTLSVPKVEARDCQFLPFTTVVRDGHGVEVVNMDPVMHDIQAYETSRERGARVLFNSPLPFNHKHKRGDLHALHSHQPGRSLVQQFHLTHGRRTFVMQCGFHAYMMSWALAVENPYYAITDSQGHFLIEGIPPGTYRLRIWHPSVPKVIEQEVVIPPQGMVEQAFEFEAPEKKRTSHTIQRPPRFGPAAIGRPSLKIRPLLQEQ